MSLKERVYSILIVSATDNFTSAFANLLPETRYFPIHSVTSISAAKRIFAEKTFDFVIINAPLPDDYGTRFAIDASVNTGTVVLLLLRADAYEEIHAKVTPHGVFTLLKPTPIQTLQQGLKWMTAARERLRKLESKALTIEEKMEEIRLVNRAKWILIEQLKMTEQEAHRHIEKQSMDRCCSKKEIALGIIKTYS